MVTYPESPVIREHGMTRFDNLNVGKLSVNKVKVQEGKVTIALEAGTSSGTDVPVAGMTTSDVLISVLSFTTASAIAAIADRTSEYTVGDGKLVKSDGTSEVGNLLLIMYYKVA